MFMKALFTSALILGLSLQTHAHAIIVPALGIPGNQGATRNDVQRPSNDAPCGKVDIMTALASATPVVAQGDGSFEVNVTNFNGGKDGSRQVQAEVDPTAFGKNFTSATVTQNGDLAPSSVGTQIVTVKLPDGLSCSGGQSNDLCLVSFKTAAGFGNCVVVQQKLGQDDATSTSASGSANSCQSAQQESSKSSSNNGVEVIYLRAKGTRAARVYRRMYP